MLLHAVNAVLLFLVLQKMTGATWPSAAVAALFAIHPLRVESVAWVTGRKDLLSGLFFLLTLAAYRAYASPSLPMVASMRLVVVCFALGLTAKSMLVTLPFVMLLLDFWPLRRIAPPAKWQCRGPILELLRVILEKIPLLALSVGSCWLTIWAQSLVAHSSRWPCSTAWDNAVLSYAAYIGQMFYPVGMVVHYPHPGPNLQLQDTSCSRLRSSCRSRGPSPVGPGGGATWPSAGSGIWVCLYR